MGIHDIHGFQVSIHDNASDAKSFLRDKMHRHEAEEFFKTAERHGRANVVDGHGNEFVIEHNKDSKDGESAFSISKKH